MNFPRKFQGAARNLVSNMRGQGVVVISRTCEVVVFISYANHETKCSRLQPTRWWRFAGAEFRNDILQINLNLTLCSSQTESYFAKGDPEIQ
jgi:hypothetical protein